MSDVVAMLQQGLAHHRAGRPGPAEAAYRGVLAVQPDEPHALHYLGLLTLADGRSGEAVALLTRAAARWPDHDHVRIALARALIAEGRAAEAVCDLRALARARPLCAAPRASLALALIQVGDPAAALEAADAALALDGADADGWFARGTALARLGDRPAALEALERAASRAETAETRLNLGNVLLDLDRRAEAEHQLRRAIALDPSLAEAHASLGCLLSVAGSLPEAIAACAEAIRLRPDFAQAHWNLSFALMLAGDYAPGWEEYEWRKRHTAFAADLACLPGREWHGEDLAGRTLLVRAEQGLGDTIQFARYLPPLVARGATVLLVCADPLVALLGQFAGVRPISRAAARASLPGYDFWIDQMSLPRLFATTPASIPAAGGYLAAAPARVAAWDAALPAGFRVGLVWAGNPAHSNDARRSMPLNAMAPLLGLPGCRFVSLQVGPRAADIAARFGIADRSAALTDLAETAALIAALDLVVTVDSCVAHLAGALGVRCWILLPFAPDWRWMTERTDSPWYASVRLFRQARAGDWRGPVAAAARALAALAPARAPERVG